MRILIIDDEPMLAATLQRLLTLRNDCLIRDVIVVRGTSTRAKQPAEE